MLPEELFQLEKLVSSETGIDLSERQLEQFSLFADLLLEWNKNVNLTSITEPQEIIVKHFVDSLTLAPWIQGEQIVDIGTGAGFPGIPLKIIFPDKAFFLVDAMAKRLDFLKAVIDELKLEKVETLHARAEDLGRNPRVRGSFDTVVSRAVARLPVLLEYAIPLLKVGGIFLAAKGSAAEEEVRESAHALTMLGAQIQDIKLVNLGSTAEHRAIIKISKIQETPLQYPRKAGTPAKKPL